MSDELTPQESFDQFRESVDAGLESAVKAFANWVANNCQFNERDFEECFRRSPAPGELEVYNQAIEDIPGLAVVWTEDLRR